MLPPAMKVNKKLLPIKGHYFLFNAGTAPLVPYLSTYARQLGFTSATVGLIYTVLPIFGLVAKPLFGVIADRFKMQKSIFILFQIVTIVSFSAIYFVPRNQASVTVDLGCSPESAALRSCVDESNTLDQCKVTTLQNQNATTTCEMNCDMTSPLSWQTICEHWGIPHFCDDAGVSLRYSSKIGEVLKEEDCFYFAAANVTLDGLLFKPHCSMENDDAHLTQPCDLTCVDEMLSPVFQGRANTTCVQDMLNYHICLSDSSNLTTTQFQDADCMVSCAIAQPLKIRDVCENWQAGAAKTCQRTVELPTQLSFTTTSSLQSTIAANNCLYVQVEYITLSDGTVHHPVCTSEASQLFPSTCEVNCNNSVLNEMFDTASQSATEESNQYTQEFWIFFSLMIASWVGQAVVVTFADAICFNLLGNAVGEYGKQRLWGSVGWGIFSLATGALIDVMSDGAYKNYAIAFILMFIFMCGDVAVSFFLKTDSAKMSLNILADVGSLLSSIPTFVFLLWNIAVGMCTGLLWQFLFWHLEDVAGASCDGSDYTKTLQGLVSAIQTFGGEIPFLFVSGYVIKKLGHSNTMSLVLFAFGIRFLLYSTLTNAWWVLPIEIFQGITFGMFYPTMTSYASIVAPPGAETTVQGLVGAVFEGVGTSLGSYIGGTVYKAYGGWVTFRWFGIGALICFVIHAAAQYLLRDKIRQVISVPGYETVWRYDKPKDKEQVLQEI